MLESLIFDTNWLCSTNQDLQNHIDSCHKKSERRTTYPEQSNANFNKFNITNYSNIIAP